MTVLAFNTSAGESDMSLQWEPELAISTWYDQTSDYIYNPPPTTAVVDGVTVTTQMHLSGKSHATAFVQVRGNAMQSHHYIIIIIIIISGELDLILQL